MLFFSRRAVLGLSGVLALGACGFRPVHAPDGAGAVLRGQVRVQAPENRAEFHLVSRLEERLGRAGEGTREGTGAARYALAFDVSIERRGTAVTSSNAITRIRLVGEAQFRITRAGHTAPVHAGRVRSFTAYSTTGVAIAHTAPRRHAEERLMVVLADQIVANLLSSAGHWP
ncbi:MAG: hypothetical protein GDA52_04710 [Rhodobacteraceae bacterium]|nr:hypothetical protein [Paracoccaceae bacterium]